MHTASLNHMVTTLTDVHKTLPCFGALDIIYISFPPIVANFSPVLHWKQLFWLRRCFIYIWIYIFFSLFPTEKITFQKAPSSQEFNEGDNADIVCDVVSSPPPTIFWKHKGSRIQASKDGE